MKLKYSACTATMLVFFIFLNGMRIADARENPETKKGDTPEESSSTKGAPKDKGSGSSNTGDKAAESSSRMKKTLSRFFSTSKSSRSLTTSNVIPKERLKKRLTLIDVTDPLVFLSQTEKLPVLTDEDWTLRLEVEEPSNDYESVNDARREIGEPDIINPAKLALIARLTDDNTLTVPLQNDAWLLRFLRLKNHNVEEAYTLIQNYYQFKTKHHEALDNIHPPNMLSIFEQNMFTVLANRDQSGRRIFLFRASLWDAETFEAIDILRAIVLFVELSAYEPTTQIVGVQVIIDMKGLTPTQVVAMKPHAKMVMDYVQYSSPVKVVKFHIINQSFLVDIIVLVFRQFTEDIMHGRALFHGKRRKEFYEWIFPEYLPEIYGGTAPLPVLNPEEWRELLNIATEEYEKITSYGVKTDQLPTPIPDEESNIMTVTSDQ